MGKEKKAKRAKKNEYSSTDLIKVFEAVKQGTTIHKASTNCQEITTGISAVQANESILDLTECSNHSIVIESSESLPLYPTTNDPMVIEDLSNSPITLAVENHTNFEVWINETPQQQSDNSNILSTATDTDTLTSNGETDVLDLTVKKGVQNEPNNNCNLPTTLITESVVESSDISKSTVCSSSTSESVFGKKGISCYLFYPHKHNKDKKKKFKQKLPYAATAPEWRAYHDAKEKEKDELEKKKSLRKIQREEQVKIKKEVDENLKKLKPKKADLQKKINELKLSIEKKKAEKKLLEIQMRSENSDQNTLRENINFLKLSIEKEIKNRVELIKQKKAFVEEEKTVKALHRKPLQPSSIPNTYLK